MPKIIQPGELWYIQRLPSIPDSMDGVFANLSEERGAEFSTALEIVRLIEAGNGRRRTVYGVNRAAQRRFPNRGVWIGLTEIIIRAWEISGWIALMHLIINPKVNLGSRLTYAGARHELQSLAVVRVDQLPEEEEVFLPGLTAAALVDGQTCKYYRVAAETNWGKYKFAVMHYEVPEWNFLGYYCRWHTRLLE
jgi:hypothetical protein